MKIKLKRWMALLKSIEVDLTMMNIEEIIEMKEEVDIVVVCKCLIKLEDMIPCIIMIV
jgi:hypothetical protein